MFVWWEAKISISVSEVVETVASLHILTTREKLTSLYFDCKMSRSVHTKVEIFLNQQLEVSLLQNCLFMLYVYRKQ